MRSFLDRLPNDIRVLIAKHIHKGNIDSMNKEYRENVCTCFGAFDGEFIELIYKNVEFNWRKLSDSFGCNLTGFNYYRIFTIMSCKVVPGVNLPFRYKFSQARGVR